MMGVIAASGWGRHFLAAMLVLWTGNAMAQQCPMPNMRQEPAELVLQTSVPEPIIRNDRKRAEMTASVAASMGNAEKSGLTTVNTKLELVPSFQYLPVGGGRFCVVMTSVKADWRITAMWVDVAAEYAPGSCNYGEVITHENEHVRFNRETFLEYAPRMEARLKVTAHDIRPMIVDDIQRGMSAMTERLRQAGADVQGAYSAKSQSLHASIDTAQSYAAVTRRCSKW